MKRIGYIWSQITSFENLLIAYKKARLGKRSRNEVAVFGLNLESNLIQLQDELINKTYVPGAYRLFTIYERKPRQISAAPFRDRVVHHALMNGVEPLLDKRFIFRSSARNRNNTDNRNNNVGFRAASPPLLSVFVCLRSSKECNEVSMTLFPDYIMDGVVE